MWLCTKLGFFSIVRKAPQEFHVRARLKKDLKRLKKRLKKAMEITTAVIRTDDADYRYRIILAPGQILELMIVLGHGIDYPNFKNRIAKDQPEKLAAYCEFWELMREVQEHE